MTAYICLQCQERRPGPGRCRICGSSVWTEDEVKVLLRSRELERIRDGVRQACDRISESIREATDKFVAWFAEHKDFFEALGRAIEGEHGKADPRP